MRIKSPASLLRVLRGVKSSKTEQQVNAHGTVPCAGRFFIAIVVISFVLLSFLLFLIENVVISFVFLMFSKA